MTNLVDGSVLTVYVMQVQEAALQAIGMLTIARPGIMTQSKAAAKILQSGAAECCLPLCWVSNLLFKACIDAHC